MNNDSHDSKTFNHSTEDRFAILWTDYLEGELDADGMAELDLLLAADEQLVARAADLYQTHRRLGFLATPQLRRGTSVAEAFLSDVMKKLPVDAATLTSGVMARLPTAARQLAPSGRRSPWPRPAVVLLAAGGFLAGALLLVISNRPQPGEAPSASNDVASGRLQGLQPVAMHATDATQNAVAPVRFVSLARARFLGLDTPPRQAEVAVEQTYVLSSGLVEIAFPRGATAILEGPAVFRVCDSDCLAIDSGRCSVHAPDGAEGFRVETPATEVVDRGTRFVVSVGETADTEVQVIEGAADLLAKRGPASAPLALAAGDAARVDPAVDAGRIAVVPAADVSAAYRRHLPDRVISYAASLQYPAVAADPAVGDDTDGIDTLEGVTVQRGGRVMSYPADRLIGVKVVHFSAGRNQHNLVSPVAAPWTTERMATADARRSVLESDRLLTSGIINPGGSESPPSSVPLPAATSDDEAIPGIAVRFTRPVVNEPGPDVIFFDLQILTDPPQGDAFHVGPLEPAAGLRWHTVNTYDIDSTSPESRLLARHRLFQLTARATSLTELLATTTGQGKVLPTRTRGNAVGIDLSALGYAEGAECDGLFFQDAADDIATIDPTFIAGLPALSDEAGEAAP